MKKIVCLFFAVLILALGLCACSTSSGGADLSAVLDDVNAEFFISGLTRLDEASKLSLYYSIPEEDVASFAAEFSSDASEYNEIIIVEAADSAAAGEVETLLQNHLDARVSEGKSYSPEAVDMLEKCSVKTYGNTYVTLVINENAADIDAFIADKL